MILVNTRNFIRKHHRLLNFLHNFIDAVIIVVPLVIAHYFFSFLNDQFFRYHLLLELVAVVIFYSIARYKSLYRSWRSIPLVEEINMIWFIWFNTMAFVLLFLFFSKTSADFSRKALLIWFVTTPILLSLSRVLIYRVLQVFHLHHRNIRKVAVIGANRLARDFIETVRNTPEVGYKLIGVFDNEVSDGLSESEVTGNLDELLELVTIGKVDRIYITTALDNKAEIEYLLRVFSETPVSIYIIPDLSHINPLYARWEKIGKISAMSIVENRFTGIEGMIKRLEDIFLSIIFIIIFFVPMLLISLIILITSPGNFLYMQKRYGLDGKEIQVLKFRTMTVAEGEDFTQASRNDPRITRFGAVLRKFSLDELPQFFNTLGGSMSIVGPRPHAVKMNEAYRKSIPSYMLRHKVKPGITGWAQVNGWRGETDTEEKILQRVSHDLYYIKNWSLWLDVKIVFMTLFIFFKRDNAY